MGCCTGFILLVMIMIDAGACSRIWTQSAASDMNVPHQSTPIAGVREYPNFVEIAGKVTPFVVSISAKRTIEHPSIEETPLFKGPFEKFFRRFREEERFETEGLGSGVIVKEDGYILTNNHVVEMAEEIQVSVFENQVFKAEIIGRDPTTDVAVIKIEGNGLPVAPLGDSDQAEVGEWVLAVGNPMRLPFTITAGIISAKGRNIDIIPGSYSIESFIQTDAAINPGNSGGPLINLKGEVVGINTAISTNTGYYQGYGFAIPINLAKRVLDDLIEKGHVVRAILGVSIRNVTPEMARDLSLEEARGISVEGFIPEDSPAQKAGLQRGDVILEIDGEAVSRVNELQTLVAQHDPGDAVTLGVIRNGERKSFTVILTEKPEEGELLAVGGEDFSDHPLGLRLGDIDQRSREAHELREDIGVVVQEVDPNGQASAAEPFPLIEGDLILEIGDGIQVASVNDLEEKLSGLKDEEELLLYFSRYSNGRLSTHYTIIKPDW
jgi:serine protease Do